MNVGAVPGVNAILMLNIYAVIAIIPYRLMLVTLTLTFTLTPSIFPWIFVILHRFLATVGGRVDIDPESGLAVYKRPAGAVGWTKLTPGGTLKHNLFNTGVTGSPQVRKGGKLMMITSISYIIIQVGFGFRRGLFSLSLVSFSHSSSTRKRFLPSATFWTRSCRGHSCPSFPPPVHAFIFIAHRVQLSRFSFFSALGGIVYAAE